MTGEAHPLAEIFPLLKGEEFDELVTDIRANGVRLPVVVTPAGLILDGRNRFRACRQIDNMRGEDRIPEHARLRVRVLEAPEDQWPDFVMSLNVHRRHMSALQRAMTAARWGALREQGVVVPTQQGRAEQMHVGVETLKQAEAVLRSGDRELIAAVEAGKVPAYKAAQRVGARKGQKATTAQPHAPVEDASPAWEEAPLVEGRLSFNALFEEPQEVPPDSSAEPEASEETSFTLIEPESPPRRRRAPEPAP
jgi:hypothetical protein